MYQYQTPTHKISTRLVILKYLTSPMSPKQFAEKYRLKQANVKEMMINMYKDGILRRVQCDCGKGYIYQVKTLPKGYMLKPII